jgi:hypothetical protein
MAGEVAARDSAAAATAPRRKKTVAQADDDDAGPAAPLPELDTLVARLPGEVRETLEELFRVRFIAVKKLPKTAFNASSAPGDATGS